MMPENEAINLQHIRKLSSDINKKISGIAVEDQILKNELAGMLSVSIIATYECIIKDALISHADDIHSKYGHYIKSEFEKSNAKIRIDDLKAYAKKFGVAEWINPEGKSLTIFHKLLIENKSNIERKLRIDPNQSYNNLFLWRNNYAHQRSADITIQDVLTAHRAAKYIVKTFTKSLKVVK